MNVMENITTRLEPMVLAPDGSWVEFVVQGVATEVIDYGRGNETKNVLHVIGHEKTIVLNATNTKALVKLFGSTDSRDWEGQGLSCQRDARQHSVRRHLLFVEV